MTSDAAKKCQEHQCGHVQHRKTWSWKTVLKVVNFNKNKQVGKTQKNKIRHSDTFWESSGGMDHCIQTECFPKKLLAIQYHVDLSPFISGPMGEG